jgi:phage portal protein BeeE
MNWFRKKKQENVEERSSTFDYLLYNCGASYSTSKAMLLSAVYRCVEVISDSVA